MPNVPYSERREGRDKMKKGRKRSSRYSWATCAICIKSSVLSMYSHSL